MEGLKNILATWPFTPLAPRPTGKDPGGALKQPVRAVLFDVYGTLLVSRAGDITTACQSRGTGDEPPDLRAPAGCGAGPETIASCLAAAIADQHRMRRAAGIDVPEVEIDRIWMTLLPGADRSRAREAALTWELGFNPVWPMPGARRVIEACRRAGRALGIVSNAQFYTVPVLERLLGASLDALGFDPGLRIFSYRLGRAKPSPMLFRAACSALATMGIAPAQALYVGNDMLNDVWAARQAGFQTALFAGDARSLRLRRDDARCAGLAPDLVLTDLVQLLNHLPAISKELRP